MLTEEFYSRTDVVQVARDLLGKVLVTNFDGIITSGIIVETEAYAGVTDRASHAYGGRRTARTETMYCNGGTVYVYLCYGIHHLFNVVTNINNIPHAVLIRAVEPLDGLSVMLHRRNKPIMKPTVTAGPGVLSQALGISTGHSGMSLYTEQLYIEDSNIKLAHQDIVSGTRVGVAYAGEDAYLPYRFWIRGNSYVSKGKGL